MHAVASASSHHTGTGGDKYYAGTAVELAVCDDTTGGHTEYTEWQQLSVIGGTANTGMLMSGGLCLAAPMGMQPSSKRMMSEVVPPPILGPRLNNRQAATRRHFGAARALGTLTEVRVTVTATNGLPNAHILEVRLYGEEGVTPFPVKP